MLNGRRVTESIAHLLDDHVELAALEYRHESEWLLKRFCAIVAGGVCTLIAFVSLQIAAVWALERMGGSLGGIALGVAAANAVLAAFFFYRVGRRDPAMGRPFEGTLDEWNRSLKWITKFF